MKKYLPEVKQKKKGKQHKKLNKTLKHPYNIEEPRILLKRALP